MRDSRGGRRSAARCVGLVVLLTAVLIAPTTAAGAAWLVVDCSGQTGDFASINAAINSLTVSPPVGEWDGINLMGDCTEGVKVTGGRRVWIAPLYPQVISARITAPSSGMDAVAVEGPSEVTLSDLVLGNGRHGLSASGNASVTLRDVSAEDNADAGIAVDTVATLLMSEGGALRNGGWGIAVGLGATATLSGMLPWMQGRPLRVDSNGAGGISVDRGVVYGLTGITVENNTGPGLNAYAGTAAFGDWQGRDDSSIVIQGNEGGARLGEGSRVTFWGGVGLRNNGTYGVYVEDGGNATFINYSGGSGGSRGVVIEGHTTVGVEVVDHSQAAFHGNHIVRANGSGLSSGTVSAGIWVDGSSHAYLDDNAQASAPPKVVNNAGYGILVSMNSSIDARSGIVRGNLASGIAVHSRSIGYLGPDSRLLGSPGANGVSLSCDSTSLVSTNLVSAEPNRNLVRGSRCTNLTAPFPRPVRPAP